MITSNSTIASGTGGAYAGLSSSGGFKLIIQSPGPNTFKISSFTLPLGEPMFAIISCNSTTTSFVAVSLRTGQIQSSATTGLTFLANDGAYTYGGAVGNFSNVVWEAAAMLSAADLTLTQLLAIAADPWRFWYP